MKKYYLLIFLFLYQFNFTYCQIIKTVAGGANWPFEGALAVNAEIFPSGQTIDPMGNLYYADGFYNVVRKVSTSGVITTIAGNGTYGYSGDGGLATLCQLRNPMSVALDIIGNIYIADNYNNCIRKVDHITGIISTIAGNGTAGYSGDGGLAINSLLRYPSSIAIDNSNNIFIADLFNNCIRKIDNLTGIITTVIGNGTNGYSGDGGIATSAQISYCYGLAIDNNGNILISDANNNRIRKVDHSSKIISTIAGNGLPGFSGDGVNANSTSIYLPQAITVDGLGNLFIADQGNLRIRKVDPLTGIITTVAGNGSGLYNGDNISATLASLNSPYGVSVDATGNLYISDQNNKRIRKVNNLTGLISTIAGIGSYGFSGDGGLATSAQLYNPYNIVFDTQNNFYISDAGNNRIRKVSSSGIITTVAGTGIAGFSGDGGLATLSELSYCSSIAIDVSGNLYIADGKNNVRIRKVDHITGIISTIAGNGTNGYSGDGGPATSAQLFNPSGISVDVQGNIYIADQNNNRIRKIDFLTGIISTIAGNGTAGYSGDGGPATSAQLYNPTTVSLDGLGNVYIADYSNHCIRKVDYLTGKITTVAGNGIGGYTNDGVLATSTSLIYPYGINSDFSGNLYISDQNNHIRKVDYSTGIISTVAGDGTNGLNSYSGDGGLATSAFLYLPRAVGLDNIGNLYISDWGNNRIREVIFTPNWTGSSSSDWNLGSNWSNGIVPTINENIIIPLTLNQPVISSGTTAMANNILIQSGAVLNVNGSLNVKDTLIVSPEASLINFGPISGLVTIQKNIVGQRGWRVFANPFSTNMTFSSIAEKNSIIIQTIGSNNAAGIADARTWSNQNNIWKDAGSTTESNIPYSLFIRGLSTEVTGLKYSEGPSPFTYSVNGTLNGTITNISPINSSNFMIVGNPYAAPVNTQALTGQTSTSYFTYQISVQSGTTNGTPNTRIKSGSWVPSSDNSSTNTTIPVLGVVAYQPNNTNAFNISTSDINTKGTLQESLFGSENKKTQLELLVEQNGNYQDKMFVRLDPTASVNGKDHNDLKKFYNDAVNLYSIAPDNIRLAIDARNSLSIISLGMYAPLGDYNFKLNNTTLPEGTIVYLKDNLKNTQTQLNMGDSYNFSISSDTASLGEHRFQLVFNSKQTETIAPDNSSIFTARVLGNITQNSQLGLEISGATGPVMVTIKDMGGRALAVVNAVNGTQFINIGNTISGMLILQISDGKNSITQKVIKL